jgi:hypothetical protein
MSEAIPEEVSRYIKINNWIFEVKMVRAIRVEEYGQPYSAIANININGDNAYVDGLMTNSQDELEREDFHTLKTYFQKLGIKQIQFDRYKNQQAMSRSFDVPSTTTEFDAPSPITELRPLQLVSVGN